MDTSSFDVLRFLEILVSDRRELARFRRDREQYLAEHGCPPEARDILLALPLTLEISTVIDLRSTLPFIEARPVASAQIDLSGLTVTLTTADRIFLAEPTMEAGLICLLLEDSYFIYDGPQGLSFRLNLAYTYPNGPNTYVSVFNIRYNALEDQQANLRPGGTARLVLNDYALLKQFNPTNVYLEEHSSFDPASGELILVIGSLSGSN